MPNTTNFSKLLLFPLIDGNCYIRKRDVPVDNKEDTTHENYEALQLMDVKVSPISATINERTRWPIIVEHKLRIVAITNDDINDFKRNKNNKDSVNMKSDNSIKPTVSTMSVNVMENNLEEMSENENIMKSISRFDIYEPYYDDSEDSIYSSYSSINNNFLDNINSLVVEDLDDTSLSYNNYRRYGEFLGHLSSRYDYSLPASIKKLDIRFNIRIGTITHTKRDCGNELYINEVFENQYYDAIYNNSKYRDKLFEKDSSKNK
eukprot:jgi/Orpsp1_1/1188818/evm.model.d7180000067407.1